MIIQPPYEYDSTIYHKLPIEDRWIMNKLALAERLGYSCGPTGMRPPKGKYCVRPIMNMLGGGEGGVFTMDEEEAKKNLPGYFWCEFFDGPIIWVQYINDKPVTYSKNFLIDNVLTCAKIETDSAIVEKLSQPLPECLRGISRYMMTESIGDKIIEVSARLMGSNAFEWIVDDYRTIDPSYDPEDENEEIRFSTSDMEREPVIWRLSDGRILKGWKWKTGADLNRRPM
jgi:hypothetical protein